MGPILERGPLDDCGMACMRAYPNYEAQVSETGLPRKFETPAYAKQFCKCTCVYNRPPWSILNFRLSGPVDLAPRAPLHPHIQCWNRTLFFRFLSCRLPDLRVNLGSGGQGGRTKNQNLKLSIDQGWPQARLYQMFLECCPESARDERKGFVQTLRALSDKCRDVVAIRGKNKSRI